METLVINGTVYKVPDWVNAGYNGDCYSKMYLESTFTGRQDWERIELLGGDYLNESETFGAYGRHFNVDGDAVGMNLVGNCMFACFVDYDGEDWVLCVLEPVEEK